MASPTPDAATLSTLLAAIDMGTNSFKLLIVRAYPNSSPSTNSKSRWFSAATPSHRHQHQPLLPSRHHSHLLALESLKKFQKILKSYKTSKPHVRCVPTAAVREAVNKAEFFECVRAEVGLEVDVLPGEEAARLVTVRRGRFENFISCARKLTPSAGRLDIFFVIFRKAPEVNLNYGALPLGFV